MLARATSRASLSSSSPSLVNFMQTLCEDDEHILLCRHLLQDKRESDLFVEEFLRGRRHGLGGVRRRHV
jgi:hypothetical protein